MTSFYSFDPHMTFRIGVTVLIGVTVVSGMTGVTECEWQCPEATELVSPVNQ